MHSYTYSFRLNEDAGETFFVFPRLPEIISPLQTSEMKFMSRADIAQHARDAVMAALQVRIWAREPLPDEDDMYVEAEMFVSLDVREAMKLEFYRAYLANSESLVQFAERLGVADTTVRRILDLEHGSKSGEIEDHLRRIGKRLVHKWGLEQAA